jgi:hypothetical protein
MAKKKVTFIQVKDVDDLKRLITEENKHDFFIQLNFGARSSKTMDVDDDGKFNVVNEIDGSAQKLTSEELFNESLTNIGKAIKYGAFYAYNY